MSDDEDIVKLMSHIKVSEKDLISNKLLKSLKESRDIGKIVKKIIHEKKKKKILYISSASSIAEMFS